MLRRHLRTVVLVLCLVTAVRGESEAARGDAGGAATQASEAATQAAACEKIRSDYDALLDRQLTTEREAAGTIAALQKQHADSQAEWKDKLEASQRTSAERLDAETKRLQAVIDSLQKELQQVRTDLEDARSQAQSTQEDLHAQLESTKELAAEQKAQIKREATETADKLKSQNSALEERVEQLKEIVRRSQDNTRRLYSDKEQLTATVREQKQQLLRFKDEQFRLRREHFEAFQTVRAMEKETLQYRIDEAWRKLVSNPEIQKLAGVVKAGWESLLSGSAIRLPARDGFVFNVYYRIRRITNIIIMETSDLLRPLKHLEFVHNMLYLRFRILETIDRSLKKYGSIGRRYCILQGMEGGIFYNFSCFIEQNNEIVTDYVEIVAVVLLLIGVARLMWKMYKSTKKAEAEAQDVDGEKMKKE